YLLHGLPGHDDPAPRPLPGAVRLAVVLEQLGRSGPGTIPRPGSPRPSGLVEPGVGPSAGLREGPGAGRVQGQGSVLYRGGEAMAPGQAARAAGPGDPAASRAGRTRTGGTDHDAVLPSHPTPATRQDAGARGHARRDAPGVSRRIPGRRIRPPAPRDREPR